MTRPAMIEKHRGEYREGLKKVFRQRINLFSYIALAALTLELILGVTFFRGFLRRDDMPGVIGGIIASAALLATSSFSKTLRSQKVRGFFFSILFVAIAVLAAVAHPELITHLGITLILLALFSSTLLLPWTATETAVIGLVALALYLPVTRKAGTCLTGELYGINAILLAVAATVCTIVKRSETVMRGKDFALQKEIEEKNAAMTKELELASIIHDSLIPKSMTSDAVDIAVVYKPMLSIGGDYAKFHALDKGRFFFMIADVTGHGVSAALLVNRIHTEIENLIRRDLSPGEFLRSLDRFIASDFGKMGIFLSAFCGVLDLAHGVLTYSSYGHPPQILFQRKDKAVVLMESQTFLMGIGMDSNDIHQLKVGFNKGDRIFLFTDGIIEAKSPAGEEFGEARLEEFVKENADLAVTGLNDKLIAELGSFQLDKQYDDIFMVSIEIK